MSIAHFVLPTEIDKSYTTAGFFYKLAIKIITCEYTKLYTAALQNKVNECLGYKGRLSWLTNSALVFETKCGGRGELRSLSQ